MTSRTIEYPGVQLNEIDRSSYGKIDYSLPQAPTSLMFGFAPKGEDESFQWINSLQTREDTYGTPENEYEMYFANAIAEILKRGGTCIAAKLPYWNESYKRYVYTDFSVSQLCIADPDGPDITESDISTVSDIRDMLSSCMVQLDEPGYEDLDDSVALKVIADKTSYLYNKYIADESAISTIQNIKDSIIALLKYCFMNSSLDFMSLVDPSLTSYAVISNKKSYTSADIEEYGGTTSIDVLDTLLTNSQSIAQNTIRIYDITRQQYGKFSLCQSCTTQVGSNDDPDKQLGECLGIVPVIVTPANALYFQGLLKIESVKETFDYSAYNQLSGYCTVHNASIKQGFSDIERYMSVPIASTNVLSTVQSDGHEYPSISQLAASQFPTITYGLDGGFDKTYLKQIGIVVLKAYKDTNNGDCINFQVVESFVGSFDKLARNDITKSSIFIDNVVNQQSQFIRVFTNVDKKIIENASTFAMSRQKAVSLGFYNAQCKKYISFQNSIMKPLTFLLDNASNPNTLPLDILVDAGVSNIAQLAKNRPSQIIDADKFPYVSNYEWKLDPQHTDTTAWKAILSKFDQFAKYTRKDCMFIADVIRPFCLDGNVKIVRKTAPQNTVTKNIIPKLKYIANALNSSYSAGYCNWFYQKDFLLDEYLWVPPSIKMAGVYIYCDTYFHPWSAPAGTTRGILNDVVDVAFVPTEYEGGQIYSNKWNYAMQYPIDGVVVEGHKTFQIDKTALDRINVRRLMLYLEKQVTQIARQFLYEGNTPYLRQKFVDTIRPVLEDAVMGDGVKEYAIKCDDELNTPQVIENNELRCKIGIIPVKVVDYIVLDFIIGRQSANITEEVLR